MSDALLKAIESGNVDRVAELLAAGADPNATIPRYYNPLQDAVDEPHPPGEPRALDVMVLLLRHGARVNGWDVNKEGDPLLAAVLMNNIDAARLLLAQGADPNVCDNAGTAPLRWCAEKGYLEMARLLLLCGATKTIHEGAGPTGMNALGFAVTRLNVDMVRLLLAHGADPRIEDVDYTTTFRLLEYAIEHGRIPEDPASQERLREIRQLLGDPSA